jgi:hypothetical protein
MLTVLSIRGSTDVVGQIEYCRLNPPPLYHIQNTISSMEHLQLLLPNTLWCLYKPQYLTLQMTDKFNLFMRPHVIHCKFHNARSVRAVLYLVC